MIALSAEQRLALAYCKTRHREPFSRVLQFDRSLGRAIQQENAPIAGQIRLAWWREEVSALPVSRTPPSLLEGPLQVLPLAGQMLTQIIDAWEVLLAEDELSDEKLLQYANGRGGGVFCIAAALSDTATTEALAAAGSLWALVDFARHCADPQKSKQVLAHARENRAALRRGDGAAPRNHFGVGERLGQIGEQPLHLGRRL